MAARFPARPEGLAELHAAFERLWDQAQALGRGVDAADRVAILTAAAEIAANIVKHSCRDHPGALVDLVIERGPEAVDVVLEDPGEPYIPKPIELPEGLPQRGMGLLVARSSLQSLEYSREGDRNHWHLVRRTGNARPGARAS